MQSEVIYKQREGISDRKLGADIMLYDEQKDKVHILNETGALIWELINGQNDFSAIKSGIIKQFPDVQPEEITRDIDEIIQKLVSEGLISIICKNMA